MIPFFEQALVRFQELEQQLADPTVAGDRARFTRLAKEHGSLARKVRPYQEYRKRLDDIAATEALLATDSDAELQAIAKQELSDLRSRGDVLRTKLEDFLLAGDEDFDSLIVEVRAGTGGDEAALFA